MPLAVPWRSPCRAMARRSADCDIRLPEVPLGINMSWQANPRISALIGPSRAKQLVILGENIGAETAAQWGLVDKVTAAGGALAAAQELAAKVWLCRPCRCA